MTLQNTAGPAAILCGATWLIGMAVLILLLAPMGYGTHDVDPNAILTFNATRPGILTAFNTVIYIVNAAALASLVVMLPHGRHDAPAAITRAFGLIWATLILAAGMVANVGLERAAHILPADPDRAADLWLTLHTVEQGLGGGNEIAGGLWITCASLTTPGLPRALTALGLVTGLAGLATIVAPTGETTGTIFGLGGIAWFLTLGAALTRSGSPAQRKTATVSGGRRSSAKPGS
ncbi:hypothetical protein [Amaricoccus tamworthensis]|uniref:hypothetical protein n=1 Tax=Amaricoccus tamworthensis TaxID=57002 RepID=UPI003C7D34A3